MPHACFTCWIDCVRRARLSRPTGWQGKQGVSLRTLYRDIAELRRQGADIEGDAGVGYRLRAGFMLPP